MPRSLLPLILFGLLSGLLVIGLGCQERIAWPVVKQKIRSDFPEVEQISAEDLSARLAGDTPPVLLDVRQEPEFRVSHLRGAVRVDPGGEPYLPEGIGKDTPIVAYCSVGYRSSVLVERLKSEGYTDVKNLEGSIFEWANKGYPVVRNGDEIRQVHPYDEQWKRLLDEELRAYSPD